MAAFAYTRIEETMLKSAFPTWLSALTTNVNTSIIFYEELPPVDPLLNIRVKIILQVETP